MAKQSQVTVPPLHTCSITADARRCQCLESLFPILKESQRACLSVCRVNWHSESLVNIVPPIDKKLARGSGMNEPFHYWDVNIVCKHDFTSAGKNDSVYSQPIFDRSICHWREITSQLKHNSSILQYKKLFHSGFYLQGDAALCAAKFWVIDSRCGHFSLLFSVAVICEKIWWGSGSSLSQLSQQPAVFHFIYILPLLSIRKAVDHVTKGSHKLGSATEMCNLVGFMSSKCHSTRGVSLRFMHHTLLLLLQLMMLSTPPFSPWRPQIGKSILPAQQFSGMAIAVFPRWQHDVFACLCSG